MLLTLAKDGKRNQKTEELWTELAWELTKDERNILAFDGIFQENERNNLISQLNLTGTYSDEHEEGSHALSVVSMAAAKRAVAEIETVVSAKQVKDEFGGGI